MIFGLAWRHKEAESSEELLSLKRFMYADGLICKDVHEGSFRGGCFLNPKLPYRTEDLIYSDEYEGLTVLLYGSVFNQCELQKELKFPGTINQPELIARMFLSKGPNFVKKLNGDFGIFINQPQENKSWLFRDQIGIKPLCFAYEDQNLFFSSDSIALSRALKTNNRISDAFLLSFFKYVDFRKTPNRKVKILEPGHYLEYSNGQISITQYWNPEDFRIDSKIEFEQMTKDFKLLVSDSIRRRCDHRFKAGAHVSGGLDSGLVSTLARREYRNQDEFYGFSWSPDNFDAKELKFDERDVVKKVCDAAKISPVFSQMTQAEFSKATGAYLENQTYFIEDGIRKKAGELGANLLFSGWGGDEFISLTDRGIDTDLLLGMKLKAFFRRNPISNIRQLLSTLFYYVLLPAIGLMDSKTKQSFRDDALYIKKPYKRSDKKAIKNFYFYKSRRRLHLGLLRFYHINQRTESWSINGFQRGIEYRYPLLDKRIVEYMLQVPSVLLSRTQNCRAIVREISEGVLPEDVRTLWHKTDPVYFKQRWNFMREAANENIGEIGNWEKNPDLQFIDFKSLEKDIQRFVNQLEDPDFKPLVDALVYIKTLHEFTKVYHSK